MENKTLQVTTLKEQETEGDNNENLVFLSLLKDRLEEIESEKAGCIIRALNRHMMS